MMNKKYYKVKCKCGHVGRSHYIAIDFPIIANNGKEAAQIARSIPRCKHHHKDCILEVSEISYEEYILIYKDNNKDLYLRCSNIQEQRTIDLSDRLIEEDCHKQQILKEETNKNIYCGKKKIRHPKKFMKFYNFKNVGIDELCLV